MAICCKITYDKKILSKTSSSKIHPKVMHRMICLKETQSFVMITAVQPNVLKGNSDSLCRILIIFFNLPRFSAKPSYKPIVVDETRRKTYDACEEQPPMESDPVFDVFSAEPKELVNVG